MARDPTCQKVNQSELARIMGVSRKWIHDLTNRGMPREGRLYDVADCVQWYLRELKGDQAETEPADVTEARRQLYLAQTEKTRLENARLRGELVDLQEATAVLYEIASIVATQHDAVAPRIAGLVVGLTDVRDIQTLLFDEHRAIRDAIAGAVARLHEPGRGDDAFAAEADGRSVGGRETHPTAGIA